MSTCVKEVSHEQHSSDGHSGVEHRELTNAIVLNHGIESDSTTQQSKDLTRTGRMPRMAHVGAG